MSTIAEVKKYFSTMPEKGNRFIQNDAAGYQFVKTVNGTMFQSSWNEKEQDFDYKFYKTFDGFCKAALWRIKRG